MSVKYRDYYEILGVPRGATQEEIRKAYRQLARQHHPDVTKGDKSDEERFKSINEAYEVLKDPEKRKLYDSFGSNWKAGQDFKAPPGFNPGGPAGAAGFNFGGFTDFHEFFNSVFNGGARGANGRGHHFRSGPPPSAESFFPQEADEYLLEVPLTRVAEGGRMTIPINGRSFEVKIPRGIAEGKKIRLAGVGPAGRDVHLKVCYVPDDRYRLEGDQLLTEARVPPHVAALGGKALVQTPDGAVALTIPAGSSSGRRLRIRGAGLPKADGTAGDLMVQIMIVFPAPPTPEELNLYEKLRALAPDGDY